MIAEQNKRTQYAFATLEDPVRLLATCYNALQKDYDDGLITKEVMEKIGPHILVMVGNTNLWDNFYPLLYYIPQNGSELDSNSDDTVLLFAPDFKALADQSKSKKPGHKLEQRALDRVVEQAAGLTNPGRDLKE
ncbi:MAG: hypothetical protein KA436_06110 [Oligoflexales bacterium]|nr:hypothetical protein [Oligoflexales bacterium]